MKLMIIAGEPSGDRIAAPAVRAARNILAARGEQLTVNGIGGEELRGEGMQCSYGPQEMAVVGIVEVLKRGGFFRRVLNEMMRMLENDATRPDTLLLVDYPGFNLRLARHAKECGVRVVYYVSPQVWAWDRKRIHVLKRVVSEMLLVFPFEEQIYREVGFDRVHFVGHPLLERIEQERVSFHTRETFAKLHGLDADRKWLLVFPGSRVSEVERHLSPMLEAARAMQNDYQAVLVKSSALTDALYGKHGLHSFYSSDGVHELMHHADLAILKSGTTTLEAALLGLPGVICYRTHPLTFAIGKRLVKLPFIGLSNIVLGERVYPELLQSEMTANRIVEELRSLDIASMRTKLERTASILKSDGQPSVRAAEVICGQ